MPVAAARWLCGCRLCSPGGLANVLGSFALGPLLVVPETRPLSFLFAVGFCGAFTTFSTFAVETVRLVEREERRRAVFNATINRFGTIVAVVAGGSIATVVV